MSDCTPPTVEDLEREDDEDYYDLRPEPNQILAEIMARMSTGPTPTDIADEHPALVKIPRP